MIQHVQQPRGSKLCGPSCVAMAAGVSLERAVRLCAGRKYRGTTEHDLRRGLRKAGILLGGFARADKIRGRRLVRLRFVGRRHGYHWLLVVPGWVHDPAMARPVRVQRFENHRRRWYAYMTSAAPIREL